MIPLAVNLMPDAPVDEIAELAVLAESRGYTRCAVYDEGVTTRDVYVTLTAIAMRTRDITLGPGITNPYVRHPGATAAAIASLDELSGGRAMLGLGAGGGLTLGPLGIARDRPLTAVRDSLQAIRRLLDGETVSHRSDAFSLASARLFEARPGVPIQLAGRGPRITALGGELADGFSLSYIHKSLLGDHVSALRGIAGDRPFRVSYSTMLATTDAEFQDARSQLTFRLVDSPPEVRGRIGMSDGDVAAIRAALADGGPRGAAHLVRDEWVGEFVLCGTPVQCAEELAAIVAATGIDEFAVPLLGAAGAADVIERTATIVG